MDFSQVLRWFLPIQNPIGFGGPDFLELAAAAVLLLLALAWRPMLEPVAGRLAARTAWCMLILAALPVALRLALLAHHPVPSPDIYDEFSHLLVADTLRHFRLANPAHPMHRFFETFFVLQEPAYSSIYPIGQGSVLALGRLVFGHPWAGVVLSVGAFCALCYWMLRAWTTPLWALAGGVLAAVEFGPLCYWMNSYWGGAVPAAAGCLVFGALPRLRAGGRARDAVLLGLGLSIHWLTRPYETTFLALSVLLFFVPVLRKPEERRGLARAAAIVFLTGLPAVAVTLLHDYRATGSWTTLPEMLSQYQYGVPAALTFQPDPVPHRPLTPEQQLGYKMQAGFQGPGGETLRTYLERLVYRVRFYRFFYLPSLYVVLPLFLLKLREWRFLWVALTLLAFSLGVNFFPAWQHHYVAAVTCLFVLVSVTGLGELARVRVRGHPAGEEAALLLLFLSIAHFTFWYSMHMFDTTAVSTAMRPYETWYTINHDNPARRIAVNRQLAWLPGRQLVFVRYHYPQHAFQDEWIYNEAAIDAARVVWAHDLGPAENETLQRYYPDRTVWLLEPDFRPPLLTAYRSEPETPAAAPAAQPAPSRKNPFLPVPRSP